MIMEKMMYLSVLLGSFFNRRNGLIVALILGVLCFILIVSFIVLYFWKREDDIKDTVKDSINEKGRVYKAIKKMILEDDSILDHLSSHNHSSQALSKSEIERIVQQKVDKALESIQKKQHQDFIQPVSEVFVPVEEETKSNSAVLYASCVNENKRSFYTVTKFPDKDTIFVLELNRENENEATFTVYDKVFKKVIGEQGYLKEGCIIENPGMNTTSIVNTLEPGLTCFKNNEWIVIQKAKVKFE